MLQPDALRRPSRAAAHDAIVITAEVHAAEAVRDVAERCGVRCRWEPQPQAALDLIATLRPRCVIFDLRTDVAGGCRNVVGAVGHASHASAVLSLDKLGTGRYLLGAAAGGTPPRYVHDVLTPRRFAALALQSRTCPRIERRRTSDDPLRLDGYARSVELHGAPLLLTTAEFDVLQLLAETRSSRSSAEIEALVQTSGGRATDPHAVIEELAAKLSLRSATTRIVRDGSSGWRLATPTYPTSLAVPAGEYVTVSVEAEVTVHGPMNRRQFDRVLHTAGLRTQPARAWAWQLRYAFAIERQDALDRALDLLRAEALPHSVALTQRCVLAPPPDPQAPRDRRPGTR
ncbi:hypothetical protein Q5424_01245 [Conexibacter sp. JD483]|uniref:hypothetical protein n=1 Tax=unclassified Conexibacter TaxID=2627773 RepID=UPI002724EF62|nr:MULTISPECIES: hypothetical protein [unclassified Conexibacter]MDO8185854.1 hypothetical protein [Conexibacter sp. CPCC 205706]MDO8198598.1 hypothetical protein [Conexibacter sp. CPCC 205762]MDR9367684.1 hypothetical protein [Conexibacter sp. JD483]